MFLHVYKISIGFHKIKYIKNKKIKNRKKDRWKNMISIIVAMDQNGLIGSNNSNNGIPWENKEDLQHFKKTTTDQTILMGRTTYEKIGEPLPNRKTIVLSSMTMDDPRVEICHNLKELLEKYKSNNKFKANSLLILS